MSFCFWHYQRLSSSSPSLPSVAAADVEVSVHDSGEVIHSDSQTQAYQHSEDTHEEVWVRAVKMLSGLGLCSETVDQCGGFVCTWSLGL